MARDAIYGVIYSRIYSVRNVTMCAYKASFGREKDPQQDIPALTASGKASRAEKSLENSPRRNCRTNSICFPFDYATEIDEMERIFFVFIITRVCVSINS